MSSLTLTEDERPVIGIVVMDFDDSEEFFEEHIKNKSNILSSLFNKNNFSVESAILAAGKSARMGCLESTLFFLNVLLNSGSANPGVFGTILGTAVFHGNTNIIYGVTKALKMKNLDIKNLLPPNSLNDAFVAFSKLPYDYTLPMEIIIKFAKDNNIVLNINSKDEFGKTLIDYAIKLGHLEKKKILIQNGAIEQK